MEKLLTKQQVADLLNISVKTIELWMINGTGPKPIRINKLVRFKESEVEAFIENLFGGKL
jgi:excisionase family DNA binding protein